MSKRTFETKDSNGCYFKCTAYYNGEETYYHAMGVKAHTLKELKNKIGGMNG